MIAVIFVIFSPFANQMDKLSYPLIPPFEGESEFLLRDLSLNEGEQHFTKGISEYSANKFGSAVSHLEKAVENRPNQGEWWLYLGVSCYLDGRYEQAIQALLKADSLISPLYKPHAKWFLAQAQLQNDNPDEAARLLKWICDQEENNIYTEKANTQLKEIQITQKN